MFVLFMSSYKSRKKAGTKDSMFPESQGWYLTE
jgi:hypothetical protein